MGSVKSLLGMEADTSRK